MDIIQLNNQIEEFVNKNNFSHDALALKQEHAIQKSEEWQRVLDSFAEQGRVLRIGIIGRVKAGKSSMLNALLFNGNDILPKAATPMTAALTIMEYSENVSAEVDFFTQQDIDEIKVKYDLFQKALDSKVKEKELEKIEVFSNGENTDESIKDDEFIKSERNIVAGKHKGEYGYYLRPARGNIYKEDGEKLIEFVKNLDYKVELKLTSFQSILVRGLKKEDVLKLKEIMSEYYGGNEFYSSYSCIGSTTCNVGILDTPPILDYIFEFFDNDEKRELTNYLPQIKVTGCPNSCATPQIARLGFSGRRKKDGEYFAIFARGEFTGKTVKLNEIVGEIKASKIPYFLEDIANIIKEENIEFEEFIHEERFIELIEKYKEFELEVVDFNDFRKADMERAW